MTPSAPAWRRSLASLLVAALLLGAASAQTLAEVSLVAAISAQFDPSIRLPSGSYRAVGDGTEAFVRLVPDASAWTDWEVYTARGIVANLQPAFFRNIANGVALAGYFESERSEREVGGARHTRVVFEGPADRLLLYGVRSGDDLVWLLARSR